MLRSMYSSVAGLKAQQIKMDTIGNNIANVSTTGFKQGDVYFKEMLSQDLGKADGSPLNSQVGLGVSVGAIDVKFTQGALQSTGRELDFAIEGDGLFIVASKDNLQAGGTIVNEDDLQYTREGIFSWDADGALRTVDGNYVIGKDGKVVTKANTIDVDVTVASQLGIATVNNYAGLNKQGNNNYMISNVSGEAKLPWGVNAPTDAGNIRSGYVEMSNVDLANEFTNMIITSRAFQANSRTITTSDEMLQELVNLKR
ncbi:flagellar hook-basal body complex protein [Turicibacter sanguinis]|uniref:flagellar hook-basal body complex protein n=1 Tax=Turicibacter sanguinis TaxID=154288 RepID=UPI0018AAA09A|nr:flagellar hook-basal body complex protein [Turicibacter sanguinis]MDB8551140.1 flagellar hook-basal body complex protein [Turicibacter sanguinis]